MATAARPTNPADLRVPCPLCGGAVHPIAGRCKHCKQDLTAHRGARPHAAVPLPALVAAPAAPAIEKRTNGHSVPIAVAAREISQPQSILPPRPTGRSIDAQERRAAWRSWPVVVIGLAVVAIVAAVVLMLWPDNRADAKRLPPPPAPERMDTNPVAPHAQAVPPPQQQHAPQAPQAPQPPQPPRGNHAGTDPWDDPAPRPRDPDDDSLDDLLRRVPLRVDPPRPIDIDP
jgi:hypothetical protein